MMTGTVSPNRFCMVPIGMLRAIGNVDGHTFPHYIADYDFFARLRAAGCRIGVTGDTEAAANMRTTGISLNTAKSGLRYAWKLASSRKSMFNVSNTGASSAGMPRTQ